MKPASLVALLAVAALPSLASADTIAITNATVRSDPTTVIEGATVLIEGKTIRAVGKKVAIPANARRIDGTGKIVTAGLVAADTRLGLIEVSAVSQTSEGSFGGEHQIHASFRVTDGFNPESVVIDVARNGGITSTIATPEGGLIAGQSAWMTLGSGSTADNTVKESAAFEITLGADARGAGDGSRGRALQRLRELLADARHYARNRANYDRGQSRPYGASRSDLEALQPLLRGQVPMVVELHRKSDIRRVLRLAKEERIRIILRGATEAWMVADELAAAKVPVIVNPKSNLPGSFDRVHVVDDNVTRLAKAGVQVIISPIGDASSARILRQLAGLAVAHGLPWEEAFAAITTHPAAAFGVARGTLKRGDAADVVVWTGDPLELGSRPEHIIVGGIEQSMENHQTRLLQRYR
jgi:imidazolonepropionase-like amidohydrolase